MIHIIHDACGRRRLELSPPEVEVQVTGQAAGFLQLHEQSGKLPAGQPLARLYIPAVSTRLRYEPIIRPF